MDELTPFRCTGCKRRLFDYRDMVIEGRLTIQKICERCKRVNLVEFGPGTYQLPRHGRTYMPQRWAE